MTDARPATPTLLILTPVKQAATHLERYFELLEGLSYPAAQLSLGMLEGDSTDATYASIAERLGTLRRRFRRVTLVRWSAGFQLPDGVDRWAPPFQLPRRIVLARARNRLLHAALHDEQWVLWLDVDVVDYPARRHRAAARLRQGDRHAPLRHAPGWPQLRLERLARQRPGAPRPAARRAARATRCRRRDDAARPRRSASRGARVPGLPLRAPQPVRARPEPV